VNPMAGRKKRKGGDREINRTPGEKKEGEGGALLSENLPNTHRKGEKEKKRTSSLLSEKRRGERGKVTPFRYRGGEELPHSRRVHWEGRNCLAIAGPGKKGGRGRTGFRRC